MIEIGNAMANHARVICPVDTTESNKCGHCVARHMMLCSQVDKSGISELQDMSVSREFAKGSVIVEQDSEPTTVFIISKGILKLYRGLQHGERQITGFLGPGDILGGIKRDAVAYCTAQAVTKLHACAFDRREFLALLEKHADLCFAVLVAATDEIEAQNDHLVLLGRKRASERLAAFLLLVARRWDDTGGQETVAHLPMSRSDIADYLGLTIETVSRSFSFLRDKGLIQIPDQHTAVFDNLPALYDLAGFEDLPLHRVALGL